MEDDPDHDATRSRPTGRGYVLAGVAGAAGALTVPAVGALATGDRGRSTPMRTFRVRIENVSDGTTLRTTASGETAERPVPLSPGAFAVHGLDEPIFTAGEPRRDNGLEELAEDGMPGRLAESLAARDAVDPSGTFAVSEGTDEPGPLAPGDAYEFTVPRTAGGRSRRRSLATMFVPSNDLFYALGGAGGLTLFDGGDPVSGDVPDRVSLWDADTEINEEPGSGRTRHRASGRPAWASSNGERSPGSAR